jgi:hypothetical protein
MKLTDAQHKQLLEHLKRTWKAPVSCPVCRANDWEVSPDIYELREFHGGSMVIGGSSTIIPIAPVTCKTCGNTVLFNPLLAGISFKEVP